MRKSWFIASLMLFAFSLPLWGANHVWEKLEITLHAQKQYANPYADVVAWVDLKGPGFEKRCYGFWDGSNVFRVRVMATAPGNWTWKSGSNPVDPGLAGMTGSFSAVEWTDKEKAENPCRRGMIRPSTNGHAFQYADGSPYFLLGDTWWAAPTFRFPWRESTTPGALGPQSGFKEYVAFRRQQEFNCVAILAALPNWANDGKPANLKLPDGTVLRSAWKQAGTDSAKAMHDEAGQRPFFFPGKVPGFEQDFPDLERLNPAYFQSMDRKIDYLNAQGFVPFIEVSRRDIGQAWKRYYPWPDSYARYIQYVWARYQANICLFSPIHFDSAGATIPAADYNAAANLVLERFGRPPFGTLAGTNPSGSSLRNWGHVDQARWLGFHQIGNLRTHESYALLTDIFNARPPVPGINGEPYYDGMENLEGGGEDAACACRSAMYGSVLSGGLGGHIYGAGGWNGGIWSGEVEQASPAPMWKVFSWPSADQMRHLKTFILSEGARYQDLEPCTGRIAPNRSGTPKDARGWAFGAGTADRDLFLLYFERGCPRATLAGVPPLAKYTARWFDPQTGQWSEPAVGLTADASGGLALPPFPGGSSTSKTDWALKLTAAKTPARAAPSAGDFVGYHVGPGKHGKTEYDRTPVRISADRHFDREISLDGADRELALCKIGDSVVDPRALLFTTGTWGICVNGQTFQQDALTSFQGYQYATWYDGERRLCVARRQSGAADWQTVRFTDHRIKGNDTHNVAVIGICPRDGTIHLAFDHHGHPLHYRVSRPGVALRPDEFPWRAELFGPITSRLEPGRELKRVTYPRFVRSPGGGLHFGCRIGGSGNGDKCLADYDPATGTWQHFGAFAGGAGVYQNSKERNPYLNGLTYDLDGRLHVTWCWRETGDPMTNHDLAYAWSDDQGKTWRNNAGEAIGERGPRPVQLDSPGVRVVELAMNRGLINATTQAVDGHNRIHLATSHLPDAIPAPAGWEDARRQSHFFHYWRADDGTWRRNELNCIGSRPQLWFDSRDNAYLVFVGDRYNPSPYLAIAAASAAKRWSDWKIIHRERGPFSSQPQLDRYGAPDVLSIYIQESPKTPAETSSALRVIDFKPM